MLNQQNRFYLTHVREYALLIACCQLHQIYICEWRMATWNMCPCHWSRVNYYCSHFPMDFHEVVHFKSWFPRMSLTDPLSDCTTRPKFFLPSTHIVGHPPMNLAILLFLLILCGRSPKGFIELPWNFTASIHILPRMNCQHFDCLFFVVVYGQLQNCV